MIICHCKVVTDHSVRSAVNAGARSLAQVCRSTEAGTVCGGCVLSVKSLVRDTATLLART